jgi:mRNA-degrading endonuclease RelE of RelBE toxin-antitoxin system
MSDPPPYTIEYAGSTRDHLRTIDAKYYTLIRQTIEQQVTHEPNLPTRNRKPLKRPIVFADEEATWELRFDPSNSFRVYYSVDDDDHIVFILAVGIKRNNRVFIANEELPL